MKKQNPFFVLHPSNRQACFSRQAFGNPSYAFVNYHSQKYTSNFKNLKNVISQVFIFCLLMLINFCSPSFGQSYYKVASNEIEHGAPGGFITKDWSFSVIEDIDLNLVNAGYSSDGVQSGAFPSLYKTSPDFIPIWKNRYTSGYDGITTQNFSGWGSFQDVLEYTDPVDNVRYYVAVGFAVVNGGTVLPPAKSNGIKLVIVKLFIDGTTVPGFPRIYNNELTSIPSNNNVYTHERRGRAIIYQPTTDNRFFYIAGLDADEATVFRLDKDLSWTSLTIIKPKAAGINFQPHGDFIVYVLNIQMDLNLMARL